VVLPVGEREPCCGVARVTTCVLLCGGQVGQRVHRMINSQFHVRAGLSPLRPYCPPPPSGTAVCALSLLCCMCRVFAIIFT